MPRGEEVRGLTLEATELWKERALIATEELRVYFKVKGANRPLKAVDGVSVSVEKGKTLGIVGESGSGKTTLAKAIVKLVKPTAGRIYFEGKDIYKLSKSEEKQFRRRVQMVFQDPFDAIDPIYSVYDAVSEGAKILGLTRSKSELDEIVFRALEQVRLTPAQDYAQRRVTSLSGGQRQRVAIARVLAMNPDALILDEPVSMLDASVRGEIMKIMGDLKIQGKTFVMITHDIATLKFFADEVVVMYLGRVMEVANSKEITRNPLHPYTQALVAAVPVPDPRYKVKSLAKGEIPSALNPPAGCPFHPRCPLAQEICRTQVPELRRVAPGRLAACHFV